MHKRILLIFISIIVFSLAGDAKQIAGVIMEESLNAGNTKLILNGAGIRTKFFMNIYVAGLYLKSKNNNFQQIMNADEPMAIKIKIISSLITAERFKEACEEGFQRTTNGNTAPFRSKINQAYTVFSQKFSIGDVFDIVYHSGIGTKFYKNGKLITTIGGLDFKRVLFGIWIIDKPSHKNEKLRQGMLGNL